MASPADSSPSFAPPVWRSHPAAAGPPPPRPAPGTRREAATRSPPRSRRVDAGDSERALDLLAPILKREPKNARALLLRSTARCIGGELDDCRKDLDQALALDPTLRQGWLNRAGLAIADKRYDDAIVALAAGREARPFRQRQCDQPRRGLPPARQARGGEPRVRTPPGRQLALRRCLLPGRHELRPRRLLGARRAASRTRHRARRALAGARPRATPTSPSWQLEPPVRAPADHRLVRAARRQLLREPHLPQPLQGRRQRPAGGGPEYAADRRHVRWTRASK